MQCRNATDPPMPAHDQNNDNNNGLPAYDQNNDHNNGRDKCMTIQSCAAQIPFDHCTLPCIVFSVEGRRRFVG